MQKGGVLRLSLPFKDVFVRMFHSILQGVAKILNPTLDSKKTTLCRSKQKQPLLPFKGRAYAIASSMIAEA